MADRVAFGMTVSKQNTRSQAGLWTGNSRVVEASGGADNVFVPEMPTEKGPADLGVVVSGDLTGTIRAQMSIP